MDTVCIVITLDIIYYIPCPALMKIVLSVEKRLTCMLVVDFYRQSLQWDCNGMLHWGRNGTLHWDHNGALQITMRPSWYVPSDIC